MGGRCVQAVLASDDLELVGAVEKDSHNLLGQDVGLIHGLKQTGIILTSQVSPEEKAGVVLDFSLPEGTVNAATWAKSAGWNLVTGTTGYDEKQQDIIKNASQEISILTSSNFSIGIRLLRQCIQKAVAFLPSNFDVTISETHHTAKKDRPSGTAKTIANDIIDHSPNNRNLDIAALRAGLVIGEHVVRFISPFEQIEFSHTALSRDLFVQGALESLRWVFTQDTPGLYSIDDVIYSRE